MLLAASGSHASPVRGLKAPVVLAAAYLVGSLPVANLAAHAYAGVDLRDVGRRTVSGSSLYEVAGFGPLALAGVVELFKGACGPLLAGRARPRLGAAAAATAIVGHNWSPFLAGGGGRGVSLALGATVVAAPEGAVLLGCGVGLGRLARATGTGTFAALVALPLLLGTTRKADGVMLAAALVLPILAKRVLGNDARLPRGRRALATRLLADHDAPLA